MRHVVRASNDRSAPPAELHIVDGAEVGHVLQVQHGSLDFPIGTHALEFLAQALRDRGYRVERGPTLEPRPGRATCGYEWRTEPGSPGRERRHECTRQPGEQHGFEHVCACYATSTAAAA